MQEIADWLKKLGMSEYTQRFAEERVDFSVLPELTDQHLKVLGLPLGDRLKMLRAIHELADPIPASPQPTLAEPDSQDATALSGSMNRLAILFTGPRRIKYGTSASSVAVKSSSSG